MNLALIIDDYLPHSTRVGARMFHELAVELRARKHHITVITPDAKQKEMLVVDRLDGITVWRFRSGPIKDVRLMKRGINEMLLSVRAWRAISHHVKPETFDGIVYYSPSIFWGGLVQRLKKKCNAPAYLVLRDLFPQWIVDAGIIKSGSLTEKYFRLFERYSYKQANRIGLMSKKNLDVFCNAYQNYSSEVLRNWSDLQSNKNKISNFESIRLKLNIQDKILFFYGGNIGHAQDMANLMRLVKGMRHYKNAYFLFVGQGDEVNLVTRLAEEWELENFTYLPSISQDEFKYILTEVDVGLFSLSASHTAHNFPGKILGYMVESLPVLGSVNAGNDLLDVINTSQAGFIHINGEDEKLLNSAIRLCQEEKLRESMGECARQLLCDQFSVSSAAQIIEMMLEENSEAD